MLRAALLLAVVGGAAMLSAQASAPAVEVASVKVNKSGEIGARFRPQPDGGITAVNMPLRGLIEFAYQLPAHRVVGMSESAGGIRYDIAARPAAFSTPSAAGWRPAALMRSVLEERFRLKVHRETQEAPIFELQVSQPGRALGPKLTRSDRDCRPGAAAVPLTPGQPPCGVGVGVGYVSAGGVSLADFAEALGPIVARPVRDRTGLRGTFDVVITFNHEQQPPLNLPIGLVPSRVDRDAPSIFTAVQEQLGLKLEPARGAVEVLVIDSVEGPTPN